MITSDIENRISKDKNILVVLEKNKQETAELLYTTENFCGTVVKSFSEIYKKYFAEKSQSLRFN